MVVKKTTKRKQVKKAIKRGQVKQIKQTTKHKQVKLAAKRRQIKRKQASKTKRNSYSIKQKKQVVDYAKKNGRNPAARHFQLDTSMVGRWMKASEKWTIKTRRYTLKVGFGQKPFYPEAEKKLYTWIIE